jgi:hypothetical protein
MLFPNPPYPEEAAQAAISKDEGGEVITHLILRDAGLRPLLRMR